MDSDENELNDEEMRKEVSNDVVSSVKQRFI
jgi:hypothetical protein